MFAIYVNDMDEEVDSYRSFFAYNTKLLRKVSVKNDCAILQQHLNKLGNWSTKWEMDFNIKKCSIMEFGKSKMRIHGQYRLGEEEIKKCLWLMIISYQYLLGRICHTFLRQIRYTMKEIRKTK